MQSLTETEIKLHTTPETLTRLAQHPLLLARLEGGWRRIMLYNQYFDTEDLALDRADLALRVRRDGDQYIQTLKGRGHSVEGLSVREEWDWYLPAPVLDLGLLEGGCWPAALASLDKSQIKPLFNTDFTRQKGLLRWVWQGLPICVEAALDQGRVVTAERHEDAICELELELREGPQAALLELAGTLRRELPLEPCDISKAERGYRLLRAQTQGAVDGE